MTHHYLLLLSLRFKNINTKIFFILNNSIKKRLVLKRRKAFKKTPFFDVSFQLIKEKNFKKFFLNIKKKKT